MTDSSILERITGKETPRASNEVESDADDLGAFGWLRGSRDRALTLELRRKNGSVVAWSYSLLQKMEFEPSGTITLWFPGQRIVIHGRNLNAEIRSNVRLFAGLTRQKVPWIQEIPEIDRFETPKEMTVVERIEW